MLDQTRSRPILRLTVFLGSALLTGSLGYDAMAAFTPAIYEARRTTAAPTIAGDLSDSAWSSAQVIGPFFAYKSGGAPAAAETTMRILWDNQFLYASLQAIDADIRSSCSLAGACGHDASLFLGDVVERPAWPGNRGCSRPSSSAEPLIKRLIPISAGRLRRESR